MSLKRNGAVRNLGAQAVRWVWPCKDGHLFWNFVGGPIGAPANQAISQWMDDDGLENPLREVKDWLSLDMASLSVETVDRYQLAISKFFLGHTSNEISEEGLKRGINASVIDTCAGVLENEQLRARDYWANCAEADGGLLGPRQFFLCNNTENFLTRTAPSAGEANGEIYGRLGLTEVEIIMLQEAGVI